MNPLLKKADAEVLKALQEIDISELEGIITQVAKTVKTSLTSIVLTGANLDDAIEAGLKSTKKLGQYMGTYINTSRSMLSQKVTDLTAENYKEAGGVPYYQYFGAPLDEKTRPECRIGLGVDGSANYPNAPYFTEEEKENFESEFGIRWNCRHEFDLITERHYKRMVGQ